MPRFRFSWSNIDARILAALCAHLNLGASDPPAALRGAFGARPREDFVEQCWLVLLDEWLAHDAGACASVATTLRERGVGKADESDDLAYLRSCRNTVGLRRVVLPEFIAAGEVSRDEPDVGATGPIPGDPLQGKDRLGGGAITGPATDSRPEVSGDEANAVERLRQWALAIVRSVMDDTSVEPDDEGDIAVPRGSIVTYVTPRDEPLRLEIYSVLLLDVQYSEQLLKTVNSINSRLLYGKVLYVEAQNSVVMTTQVSASGLSENSFLEHLGYLSGAADFFDTQLNEQFGGRMIGEDRKRDEQIV